MNLSHSRIVRAFAPTCLFAIGLSTSPVLAGPVANPQPIGSSTMSITYQTVNGAVEFAGLRSHDGTGLGDITNLNGAPNVGAFSANNTLGRRPTSAQGSNETLMRHGFYKYDTDGLNINDDFFPGVLTDSNVVIEIRDIEFDRPVQVQTDTVLLHALWNLDQVDQLGLNAQNLPRAYSSPHNHHTVAGIRDLQAFKDEGIFLDNPVANYNVGAIVPAFSQSAPNMLDVTLSFPYELLRHLQDDGLGVPAGLPGPGGFLEPFHFHLEYLVVPEPTTAVLLSVLSIPFFKRQQTRGR